MGKEWGSSFGIKGGWSLHRSHRQNSAFQEKYIHTPVRKTKGRACDFVKEGCKEYSEQLVRRSAGIQAEISHWSHFSPKEYVDMASSPCTKEQVPRETPTKDGLAYFKTRAVLPFLFFSLVQTDLNARGLTTFKWVWVPPFSKRAFTTTLNPVPTAHLHGYLEALKCPVHESRVQIVSKQI